MNNNYTSYKSYVESTDYYQDLSIAIKLCNEMIINIDNLINVLNRNNGDPIASAIVDLDKMKKDVNSFIKHYKEKKDKIIDNAGSYDAKFNSLKSSIGSVKTSSVSGDKERKEKIKSVTIDESTGYIRVEKEITISPKLEYVYDSITKKYYLAPKVTISSALSTLSGKSVSQSYDEFELYNLSGRVS